MHPAFVYIVVQALDERPPGQQPPAGPRPVGGAGSATRRAALAAWPSLAGRRPRGHGRRRSAGASRLAAASRPRADLGRGPRALGSRLEHSRVREQVDRVDEVGRRRQELVAVRPGNRRSSSAWSSGLGPGRRHGRAASPGASQGLEAGRDGVGVRVAGRAGRGRGPRRPGGPGRSPRRPGRGRPRSRTGRRRPGSPRTRGRPAVMRPSSAARAGRSAPRRAARPRARAGPRSRSTRPRGTGSPSSGDIPART